MSTVPRRGPARRHPNPLLQEPPSDRWVSHGVPVGQVPPFRPGRHVKGITPGVSSLCGTNDRGGPEYEAAPCPLSTMMLRGVVNCPWPRGQRQGRQHLVLSTPCHEQQRAVPALAVDRPASSLAPALQTGHGLGQQSTRSCPDRVGVRALLI